MRSDVSTIKFDGKYVTMPLEVYEEMRAFARGHGEIHLPYFEKLAEAIPGTVEVISKPKDAK